MIKSALVVAITSVLLAGGPALAELAAPSFEEQAESVLSVVRLVGASAQALHCGLRDEAWARPFATITEQLILPEGKRIAQEFSGTNGLRAFLDGAALQLRASSRAPGPSVCDSFKRHPEVLLRLDAKRVMVLEELDDMAGRP